MYLGTVFNDESRLTLDIENILESLNKIINGKYVEQYKISKIFAEEKELQEVLASQIDIYSDIRATIARYYYTKKYDVTKFEKCIVDLNNIYELEVRYYEKQKLIYNNIRRKDE